VRLISHRKVLSTLVACQAQFLHFSGWDRYHDKTAPMLGTAQKQAARAVRHARSGRRKAPMTSQKTATTGSLRDRQQARRVTVSGEQQTGSTVERTGSSVRTTCPQPAMAASSLFVAPRFNGLHQEQRAPNTPPNLWTRNNASAANQSQGWALRVDLFTRLGKGMTSLLQRGL